MPILSPNYGSMISFNVQSFEMQNNDGYTWQAFQGTNSVGVTFDILLKNQTLAEATSASETIHSITGESDLLFVDPSNFFKDMYLSFDSFRTDFAAKNAYDVKIRFSQMNEATDLSMFEKFVKRDVLSLYATGQQFYDGDIVYDESKAVLVSGSGGLGFSGGTDKKCFYYCIKDHIPTGVLAANPNFVQDILPIEFEDDLYFDTTSTDEPLQFRASFDQRVSQSLVKNKRPSAITTTFNSLTDRKAKQLMHFCENRAGSKRFSLNVPTGIFRDGNVFGVSQWSNRWDYEDANSVTMTFQQDVRFQQYVEAPTGTGLFPALALFEPVFFVDSRSIKNTGIGGKISTIIAPSIYGEVVSYGNLTSDSMRIVSGIINRPSDLAPFIINGGLRFYGGPSHPKWTTIMHVKPNKTGIHEFQWIYGYIAKIVTTSNTILMRMGAFDSAPIAYVPGEWITLIVSGDAETEKITGHIVTGRNTSTTVQINYSYDEGYTDIIFMSPPIGASSALVGDVRYMGFYKSVIPQKHLFGINQYMTRAF